MEMRGKARTDIKKPVKRALLISFGSQDSVLVCVCVCVCGPDSWHSCSNTHTHTHARGHICFGHVCISMHVLLHTHSVCVLWLLPLFTSVFPIHLYPEKTRGASARVCV